MTSWWEAPCMDNATAINIEELERELGYSFRDPRLLVNACTHRSYTNENPSSSLPDNERLEFLGDAVLQLGVSDLLMARFPDFTEGQLSKIRAAVVNEQSLAGLARKFALGRHLLLGKDQRFVNRVKIARRQFGQTREPFRNIGTGLLAALAATHAVAHHIHAVACAGAVLVVFPTQADIAVQTDLNMFDVHESRPFTPIFRKRIFRKWNTSASDSFARHLRNVGSEPSMNFRSSAMSCQ